MNLREKIKKIPPASGVYLMKGAGGTILYVGKAQSLPSRLNSYFREANLPAKVRLLMSRVKDIDYVTTASAEEALILECRLIKQHRPRYNVSLRDDKEYPYLKITVGEDFPRLSVTRRIKKDKAKYFGPYVEARSLRHSLRLLRKVFPLRVCRDIKKSSPRPCLYFQIGECPAPCRGKISKKDYRKAVRGLVLFLSGRRREIIEEMGENMRDLSARMKYEEAALTRDKIRHLRKLLYLTEASSVSASLPREEGRIAALRELRAIFALSRLPRLIHCLDISNIRGKEAVGSAVVFRDGYPCRRFYRRFKIRGEEKTDDYAMTGEVLRRHLRKIKENKEKTPSIILLDGGAGHLNVLRRILAEFGMRGITPLALAKEEETIYFADAKKIFLGKDSPGLNLLMHLRDEAHRFAHAYFSLLSKKKISSSRLDDIPGIGEEKKRQLLQFFGSLEMIKKASLGELRKVRGIDLGLARRIKVFLQR